MECCGITHGRELLNQRAALGTQVAGQQQQQLQLACMMGCTPGPTYVEGAQTAQQHGGQGLQRPQVPQQQQLGQEQQAQ